MGRKKKLLPLRDVIRIHIAKALVTANFNIREASVILGFQGRTLDNKLRGYNHPSNETWTKWSTEGEDPLLTKEQQKAVDFALAMKAAEAKAFPKARR